MRSRSDGFFPAGGRHHMKRGELHFMLWCLLFSWTVALLILVINDGVEQNPALMLLVATEMVIHLVWILLDRRLT